MQKAILMGIAGATAAVIAAGCSGGKSSGASNAVTGNINGAPMSAKSGSFATLNLGSGSSLTFGVMTDDPNFCADIATNPPTFHKNEKVVVLQLGSYSGGSTVGAATAPGAYTYFSGGGAPAAQFWLGAFQQLDANCASTSSASASFSGGTLNVTGISSSVISGTGTALPLGADTVGLKFDLENCPALAALSMSTSTAQTCAN